MLILLEIACVAILAILVSRLAPEPWKGRILNVLKAWITIRAFWLLLSHPVQLEDGTQVIAWRLILETVQQINAVTFWTFVGLAAGVKFVGILASMYRWVVLLRGQQIELPFRHIFGSFLIGRFIGTFLPSTAGLDGYKLYDASRFSGRTVETTAATAIEKILGVTGIFLTYIVSLPFGIGVLEQFLGDRTPVVAALSIALVSLIIGGLLTVLWFPGLVQWVLENMPIPGKARLEGIVHRLSNATAAYRDKKPLVLQALFLSFVVHFTTAAMYFFTALAIGASEAKFWEVTFGSSIQILATVLSPFTIAGEGIREAAQYLLLSNMLGAGPAIVSAALGFWAAEALTLLGGVFWWIRPSDYTPEYCRVRGVQVDYAAAAKAAVSLETEEERAKRHAAAPDSDLPPLGSRVLSCAGHGLGGGIVAGLLIGITEALVIAAGGFGDEAQVLWYGPLDYALLLGGLAMLGGAVLGVLPMDREDARGWVPSLAMIATLVPFGLAITLFRLRRDVYLEQMPPVPVLLGVLGLAGILTLALFFVGPRVFRGAAGRIFQPLVAIAAMAGVVLAGAIAAAIVGPGGDDETFKGGIPAHVAKNPNVILVMVDTLRADHLSCYGADVKTPNICSLAEDGGSRWEGFSHASWTKPATASLLTSLLPSTHNAMSKPSSLSSEVVMISEVMKDRGYTTGGIVSNINLAPSFGFQQGYDEYHYLGPDYLFGAKESSSKLIIYNIVRAVWFKLVPGLRFGDFYQDSQVVNEVASSWLDRHADDRFFLFLHYMDPHDPYFEHPYDGTAIARVSNQHPDGELAAEMQRLYVEEIEYLDKNFGELLDHLRKLGVYDETLIVLVADHGEEFMEHGGWWHGLTLYDEQIRIPFLVKWPKGHPGPPATSLQELARAIDVAPTLAAAAGAEIPAEMQGVDLMNPNRPAKDQEVYSEEDHEGNVLWSLRTRDFKLIKSNPGNPRGLEEEEFFAISKDPGETKNIIDNYAYDADDLSNRAELQRKFALGSAVEPGENAEMSPEECEQLKNLGYLDPSTDCMAL